MLCLALAAALVLVARQHSADLKAITAANLQTQKSQLDLIEQSMRMIRSADPWTYQAITAVGQPGVYDEVYDPSPEAEAQRIAERDNDRSELEEELNAEERAALGDIFPGY